MHIAPVSRRRRWLGVVVLLFALLGIAAGLVVWKRGNVAAADAAAASQPEPMETVTVAAAKQRQHRRTTTAIGTVLALRSITLHNELPGTVHEVALVPGALVEAGALLVALDVSVENAELRAQQAQAALAETVLQRMQRAVESSAASAVDVDRARAERDVALAQVARTEAIIARKTIRAPFRARVGMADIHPGQYLNAGTRITTLQGIDNSVDVDFTVTQLVASGLKIGEPVAIVAARGAVASSAKILAIDARVDRTTRNVTVRARLESDDAGPTPGASVRVQVPVGPPQDIVTVPVSALRKGPAGDHVFVVAPGEDGRHRARMRMVQSGSMLGDEIVVTSGLKVGEQVAATGSFKLYDSVLVNVAAPPPGDTARSH